MSYSLKRSQLRNGGLMLFGAGLIVLGIVAGLLIIDLQGKDTTADAANGQRSNETSVVPVEVNFKAPDLFLKDLSGEDVSIIDHIGKVILINNWAIWCPPCKEEMPALESYYQAHHSEEFILIAIDAGDPQADVADFVSRYVLSFPVWLDASNKALQAFNNYGLPSSYVIDKNGIVRVAWTGAISEHMLEKYVTPLIEE